MVNRTIAIFMAVAALAAGTARADETASASSSASTTVSAAPAAKANLYILRVYAEPTAVGATISVDGTKVAEVRNKHYTAVYVPPGDHKINFDWPWWTSQRQGEIGLTIREGAIHYLEITGISQVTGFGYQSLIVTLGSGVAEIDPVGAEEALKSCCKYQAPRVADLGE